MTNKGWNCPEKLNTELEESEFPHLQFASHLSNESIQREEQDDSGDTS